MARNRDWMYVRFGDDGMSNAFLQGVEEFIAFAFSKPALMLGDMIRCPCSKCKNRHFQDRADVIYHLYSAGFMEYYKQWVCHGEEQVVFNQPVVGNEDSCSSLGPSHMDESENPYREIVFDGLGQHLFNGEDVNEAEEFEFEEEPNAKAQEFYKLLKDADTPLWEGCKKQTNLSFVSQMLNIKSDYNQSEACFNRIMASVGSSLPETNNVPKDFYSSKKMLKGLGLGYEKIDVCNNNCMLFYKENSSLDSCSVCGHARYKPAQGGKGRKKGTPYKVLRYLPLIPRLQRLYMSRKTAEHMTWHAKPRTEPVCHPSGSEAWKHFQSTYPDFKKEERNVYVAICTDGFTPFTQSAKPYSCWPVMVTVYNLPPSMCMTRPFIFLSLIIPGPKSPGKQLDVFLRPLIDELKLLWNEGIKTYDAYKKQNFQMRAAVMWTISDFPAFGMLCGWSTHGRLACPYCMERTKAFRLENGGKPSWFDCHRQFLPLEHPFRRQRDKFMTTTGRAVEKDPPIPYRSGEEMQRKISELTDGELISGFGKHHNWTKKSIFWELPYWPTNLIRHNLDMMHVEKNFFDNVWNTVMDVKGKSKDNPKARSDLEKYCKRSQLHLIKQNGKWYKPKATYVLAKEQRKEVCMWAKQLRFPDGYAFNIGNCVSLEDYRFHGMKSHDCHVFMQRLLPSALRDLVPNALWDALTEMSNFFKEVCSSSLKAADLEKWEVKVVETICKLEKIFPPSFFDSMEHLPIHLAHEAKLGGPVQYRWMYPFERFLYHLKRKVKNKARVEGSICEAYIIEEIGWFCSQYFEPEIESRYTRVSRNEDFSEVESTGKLSIFNQSGRQLGRRTSERYLTETEYHAAANYVLFNCEEMQPLIEKFHEQSATQNITEAEMEKNLQLHFRKWLENYANDPANKVDDSIKKLAEGPGRRVTCFNGFFVNGFRFHTESYGSNKKTMNSGVWVKGSCYEEAEKDYYGKLKEVVELEYLGAGNRVVLFKCHWFEMEYGIRVHREHGFVEVDMKSKLKTDEEFVLAEQATQVYYVNYASKKRTLTDWSIAYKVKPSGAPDIHETESQNRLASKHGTVSTHTGGSVNFPTHRKKMEEERKRPVGRHEVYLRTHKKQKGTGPFVDKKSELVEDKYRELLVGKYGPEIAEDDAFWDEDLWKEAAGGVEKGRLYGQGPSNIFLARARASAASASSAASTSHESQQLLEDRIRNSVREEMREEMEKQVEERLAAMKKECDEEMKKRDEEMKKRDEEQKKRDEEIKKLEKNIDALMKAVNPRIE